MTISTDTIRTVIEIVPGWKIYEGRYAQLQDEMAETPEGYRFFLTDQILLDYLAAAAVREIDKVPRVAFCSYECRVMIRSNIGEYLVVRDGPNRTENTLLAIAEFVNKHGELFDV